MLTRSSETCHSALSTVSKNAGLTWQQCRPTHQQEVNTRLTWFDWLWFAVSRHRKRCAWRPQHYSNERQPSTLHSQTLHILTHVICN